MSDDVGRHRWLRLFGLMGVSSLIVFVFVALVLSPLLGVGYFWLGWNRMTDTCPDLLNTHNASVSFSYSTSLSNPGFTCTWSDGHQESKLWW
jgi:hypothetical protein